MNTLDPTLCSVAVVGAGPAGLMAAEVLAARGLRVDVFDAMPSVGRKFLLAGRGGLNLTHSESLPRFKQRFGSRQQEVGAWLDELGPEQVRSWAEGLGQATFVGSSGRVFPVHMKAAPLLRAWLQRLKTSGVIFHMRHRWQGWDEADAKGLRFEGPGGQVVTRQADALLLALGGGSWPRLGSDGRWVPLLRQLGVPVQELRPANCGFDVGGGLPAAGWSAHFRERHAGHPLKSVALGLVGGPRRQGEFVITQTGIEGSLVYSLSAAIRDAIEAQGCAEISLDLLPARSLEWVAEELAHPRGSRSLSTHLKTRLGLQGVKLGLLHELLAPEVLRGPPSALAERIKDLRISLLAARPLPEAISSAGGVDLAGLDAGLMLQARPGIFCAGEMLDWEAPTGGYLLTACLASGQHAGQAAADWLARRRSG